MATYTVEELREIISPLAEHVYAIDQPIMTMERQLTQMAQSLGGVLEMKPEVQRDYCWTQEQQIVFIESFIQGTVTGGSRVLTFSHPYMGGDTSPCEVEANLICVDGLQRYTAIQSFLNDEFKVFGGRLSKDDLERTEFSITDLCSTMRIQVFAFRTYKEIYKYYLMINKGGTAHSKDELNRIQKLYDEA